MDGARMSVVSISRPLTAGEKPLVLYGTSAAESPIVRVRVVHETLREFKSVAARFMRTASVTSCPLAICASVAPSVYSSQSCPQPQR